MRLEEIEIKIEVSEWCPYYAASFSDRIERIEATVLYGGKKREKINVKEVDIICSGDLKGATCWKIYSVKIPYKNIHSILEISVKRVARTEKIKIVILPTGINSAAILVPTAVGETYVKEIKGKNIEVDVVRFAPAYRHFIDLIAEKLQNNLMNDGGEVETEMSWDELVEAVKKAGNGSLAAYIVLTWLNKKGVKVNLNYYRKVVLVEPNEEHIDIVLATGLVIRVHREGDVSYFVRIYGDVEAFTQ